MVKHHDTFLVMTQPSLVTQKLRKLITWLIDGANNEVIGAFGGVNKKRDWSSKKSIGVTGEE